MKIQQIAFFNHYHNGDLFHSKPFIADIINKLKDVKVCYFHGKDIRVIADLEIPQFDINLLGADTNHQIIQGHMNGIPTLFVNTWIGAYFNLLGEGDCSFKFTYRMWKHIYDSLKKQFWLDIDIDDDIIQYWASIDYKKYHTINIDYFIEETKDKMRILICNSPGESGQCVNNTDLEYEIRDLAEIYKDHVFITTARISNPKDNIFYSGDITRVMPDLNEISYLSKSCSLIVGRSSGPFCFSTTKENINDPNKTFFCFGDKEKDGYPYDMPTKAKYVFHKYVDQDTLVNKVSNLIKKI